jgi:Tol biopolymer transport system component
MEREGSYLGETPPGLTPAVFAPGIISKAGFHLHSSLAFSPDGTEICFTGIVFEPESQGTIWCLRRGADTWGEPKIAPFSGIHNDDSAVFSPDGRRLYFTSGRPVGEHDGSSDLNIWYVEREGESWGEPIYAGHTINSDYSDFRLSFAADSTIYLSSDREGHADGTFDIFVSRKSPDGYSKPEKLGRAVNTPATEQIAFVSPDERYLIFYRYDRNEKDDTGLYISFRGDDGHWSIAKNMGGSFNSPPEAVTQAASLSPDGEYVFFLRRRHEAIYWVEVSAVASLGDGP